MISGLLQTAEYAQEFLHRPCGPLSFGADEETVEQMIAKRMQRQQVLYQHGKQVQVVMLEAALRARVVSVTTLTGQLDRLLAVIGLPALELGIIPFEADVPVYPLSGFRLYDASSSSSRSWASSSSAMRTTWPGTRNTSSYCASRRAPGARRQRLSSGRLKRCCKQARSCVSHAPRARRRGLRRRSSSVSVPSESGSQRQTMASIEKQIRRSGRVPGEWRQVRKLGLTEPGLQAGSPPSRAPDALRYSTGASRWPARGPGRR